MNNEYDKSIKFSEIPYARPDLDEVKGRMEELTASFRDASSYQEARDLFVAADTLKRHVATQSILAEVRHSIDTRDKFYDDEMNFWNNAGPELENYTQAWRDVLCDSPYRKDLTEEFGEIIFINMEMERRTFDPQIIPLLQEENELVTEYQKLIASAQIPFQGKNYTIAQMDAFKNDRDDDTRLSAWKAEGQWYRDHQEQLDGIYDRMVAIRHEMSRKLGFKDFVEMGYYRMTRNCYDRGDVENFRRGVRDFLVPVAEKIRREQAERLGVAYPMSFSDCALMFRSGNAKPQGSADDIMAAADRFYDELSPETGEFFRMMRERELMDLIATEGKAGGGYCTSLFDYDVPFIFANFNGTRDDVETVTHEAGHAFADWISKDRVPMETIWPGMEGCEVHSMSMEFFAWKAAEGFFGKDADKFRYSHLASGLLFIPYGTMVDHFQHIVYENPGMTPAERHGAWKELLGVYMPWLRLDGDIPFYADGMGWQRQNHIYCVPFYYIDYCLAQTVALEFWAMMQEDYPGAWEHYMAYTRQGGTKVFTELLAEAGMESPFEEETLRKVCRQADEWLKEFKEKTGELQ